MQDLRVGLKIDREQGASLHAQHSAVGIRNRDRHLVELHAEEVRRIAHELHELKLRQIRPDHGQNSVDEIIERCDIRILHAVGAGLNNGALALDPRPVAVDRTEAAVAQSRCAVKMEDAVAKRGRRALDVRILRAGERDVNAAEHIDDVLSAVKLTRM